MSTGVGDVYLDLKLNKQPFEKGMSETKAQATRLGSSIGKIIAGSIATAVGTIGFTSLISKTTQLGDTVDKMSQKLGMSQQAYQEWDYIMQICGSSIESLQLGMKTLASSAETSKDALAELGITQQEVASLSQEELFSRTVRALQQVEDTTKRTYLAGQLLGRGATELGPLLNLSAQDTENLRNRLYELGGAMSQTAVNNSAQLQDAVTSIKFAFRGIADTVATYVLPVITKAIYNYIIPAILTISNAVRSVFASIGGSLGWLGGGFKKIGDAISGAFNKAKQQALTKTAGAVGGIGKAVGGAGKSAKKAKKAVKELRRELMGFDKINKLTKKEQADTGSGAGSGGGGGAGGAGGAGGLGAIGGEATDLNKKLFDLSKIGEKLGPIWKALGDVFKAFLKVVKAFVPVGKILFNALVKPLLKIASKIIVAILQGVAGALELIAMWVEKHPKLTATIIGVVGAILGFKKLGGIVGIIAKFKKAFGALGLIFKAHPFAIILTAIALAVGYIYKNWDKIKKTKFGKLLIALGKLLKPIMESMAKLANKILVKLTAKWKSVKQKLTPVIKLFGKFAKTLGGRVLDVATKFVEKITDLKDVWKGLKSKTLELKAKIGEGIENIGDALGDAWEGAQEVVVNIKAKVATRWADIKDSWNNLIDNIKDKTAEMKAKVGTLWSDIKDSWHNITDNVKEKVADMKAKVATKWSDIKKKWHGVTDNIKTKTANMKAKIATKWSDLKQKWKNLIGHFKTVTATIKVKLTAVVGKLYNSVARKVNAMKAEHPILFKLVPKLPLLAQGGFIGRNTPRLAVIGDNTHEGEIVSPESKLRAMAEEVASKSNGNNAQVVNLLSQLLSAVQSMDTNVYLDGKAISKNTVKNINQQTRTTGRSPILV